MGIKNVWEKIKDWFSFIGVIVVGVFMVIFGLKHRRGAEERRELERRIDGTLHRMELNLERLDRTIKLFEEGIGNAERELGELKRNSFVIQEQLDSVRESIVRSEGLIEQGSELDRRTGELKDRFRDIIERVRKAEQEAKAN